MVVVDCSVIFEQHRAWTACALGNARILLVVHINSRSQDIGGVSRPEPADSKQRKRRQEGFPHRPRLPARSHVV